MKNLSPTQHACLDAMGIDVWVSRDQPEEDEIEFAAGSELAQVIVPPVQSNNEKIEAESVPESDVQESGFQEVEAKAVLSDVELAVPEKTIPQETVPQETVRETTSVFDVPADWNGLQQTVSICQRCTLHSTRTQTVFGAGSQHADWLIIGDTPNNDDDKNGKPFTGQSGDLLTAMLRAITLTRQHVYITNTLKCTTPNNREPEDLEIETCLQYLHQQIKLIKPKLILVMGQSAAQRVLNTHSTLARLRQKTHTLEGSNIPVIVTYHPASLLSMPTNKAKAWQDLLYAKKTISTEAVL